jgi:two-component system sensor histidine kinase KdpD
MRLLFTLAGMRRRRFSLGLSGEPPSTWLGLLATPTAEERAELSAAIVAEGERLSRLVENLLDMSRLEAGKAEPHREPIDLAEVLDAACQATAQPEVVRLAVDRDLPMVAADAAQLERAFANLLENAVRHGGGRPVLVKSRLIGGKITVRVVDQGPGIPESEWRRIFEPFQHGEADGAQGGAGLGLAIAKGFVEANGGEIAVESLPRQGSSFVVSMPYGDRP